MLQPIQRTGSAPPLILIHGLYGVMPLGPGLASVLGPDQPLFVINARGVDGRQPPHESVEEMAADYSAAIMRSCPSGPCLVGSICTGAIAAIEVARRLIAAGRSIGRLLLIDPPAMPFSTGERLLQLPAAEQQTAVRRLQQQVVAEFQSYAARFEALPFAAGDPENLRSAASAGAACMMALSKHRPGPFAGPTELIVSERRVVGYVNPEAPWQRILVGPRWMHILPGVHADMFGWHSDAVFRLVSFYLETALSDILEETDLPEEPALARSVPSS